MIGNDDVDDDDNNDDGEDDYDDDKVAEDVVLDEASSQLVTLGCNIDIESSQLNRKRPFPWTKPDDKTFCSALTETVW